MRSAALVFLLLVTQPARAQEADDAMASALRANVVKIEVAARDNTENGFGFIVGQRSGQLYIVTARHVIFPTDEPNAAVPKVSVTFFSDQGRRHNAEVLGTHDKRHDLAVLTVPAQSGLGWIKESLGDAASQNRGTRVWYAGRSANWRVPVQPGFINSERPSNDGQIDVEGLTVRPGSSGGPLIAKTGIVGMILKDSEEDARALSIDFIRNALHDWNHPWDLTRAAASAAPREITRSANPPSVSYPPPPAPQNCRVSIDSTPSGADIYIDGVSKGSTPTAIELTPKTTYELSVSKGRYKTYSQRISCATPRVTANLQSQGGSIFVRYTGDLGNCSLLLNITLGNKTFLPTSNLFPVTDVELGMQRYMIKGTVSCPLAGSCLAVGAGTLNVQDRATYDVGWLNTGVGTCTVVLAPTVQ